MEEESSFFGDKNTFAIESRPVAWPGEYRMANVCYWIDGVRVGHFDEIVVLGACVSSFIYFQERTRPRNSDPIRSKPKQVVLQEAVWEYTGEGPLGLDYYLENGVYDYGVLAPNGSEAFDGIFVLLLEGEDYDRIVWRGFKPAWWDWEDEESEESSEIDTAETYLEPEEVQDIDVQEIFVKAGECQRAIRQFTEWVAEQEKLH